MLAPFTIVLFILSFVLGRVLARRKKKFYPYYFEDRSKVLNAVNLETPRFINNKIFRIVVELDHPGGRVTSEVFPNGNIVDFSNGEAPNGADQDDQPEYVRSAANELFALAQGYWHESAKTTSMDFPPKDCVQFHLLAPNGRALFSASLKKVDTKGHTLHPLYAAYLHLRKEHEIANENKKYVSGSQYVVIENRKKNL
jgi:hypothetical protein